MLLNTLGWILLIVMAAVLVICGIVLAVYFVAAVGMSFYFVFLMAVAYIKGGKEGLKRHNEEMKAKAAEIGKKSKAKK